jgi:uncharacterized Fe-S center protein
MTTVYLVPATAADPEDALARKVEALWRAAGLAQAFQPRDLTALKLHVGEPGTRTYVRPAIAAALVRLIRDTGATPFLTDTAVLYKSPRDTGPGHAQVAHDHGFGLDRMGAPFVPADGLIGADEVEIRVGGKHFETVAVASGIMHARSLLVLSHATGHLGTGFAAALKNLGMGCASRKGKLRQHHGQHPRVDSETCSACATCEAWCPQDAITVEDRAVIDARTCIGCGECVAHCRDGAITFDWSIMGRELQERIVEHAAAIVRGKPGRIAYVTAVQGVTRDCDCMGEAQEPLLPDIGLLAGLDPVAIDQAAHDLVRERAGRTLESMSYRRHDGAIQLRYAESLGLGRREYELKVLA